MEKSYSFKETIVLGDDEIIISVEVNHAPRNSGKQIKDLVDASYHEIMSRLFQSVPDPSP